MIMGSIASMFIDMPTFLERLAMSRNRSPSTISVLVSTYVTTYGSAYGAYGYGGGQGFATSRRVSGWRRS